MTIRAPALLALFGASGCGFISDADWAEATDRDGDGWVAQEAGGQDCDDEREDVRPDAEEICEDGVDQDCDGEDPDCPDTGGGGSGDGGDGAGDSGGGDTGDAGAVVESLGPEHDGAAFRVSQVGDLDGGGLADLVVGAHGTSRGEDNNVGVVYPVMDPVGLLP